MSHHNSSRQYHVHAGCLSYIYILQYVLFKAGCRPLAYAETGLANASTLLFSDLRAGHHTDTLLMVCVLNQI
jgi:hypothetical protein